jgi:hypothetical protein
MLEILLLIALSKRIGAIARDKGRGAGGWVALLILLWFGGEIMGGVVGAVASIIASGAEEPNMLVTYVGALAGAAAGAVTAFATVHSLAPIEEHDKYWQPPESEAYREKFNPEMHPTQPDAEKYRAGEEKRSNHGSVEDPGYRARAEE